MSVSAGTLMMMTFAAAQGGDQQAPPTVPLAPAFANLPAASNARAPSADWWTVFDDPPLNALVETALAQNFDIAEAAARLDRARAGVRAADGARMPQLSFGASAAVARLSEEDPQLGASRFLPGFDRTQDRYALTAGASWEIDLFGRLGARTRAARADALASARGLDAARLAVASEIAQRYVSLRLLQQRRIVAEHRAGALAEMARLANLRVERGISPAIERDRVTAEARAAAAVVPQFLSAIEDQLARIDVVAGREIGTSRNTLQDPAVIPAPRAIDLSLVPADLLRRRPDVLAAEATLAGRDARVAAALADWLPRFNLGGLLGLIAGAINPLFGAAAFAAQGEAAVSYTAFDGGRSRANVDAARADVRASAAAYQQSVLSAVADVESAAAARTNAEARIASLGEAERRLESTMLAVRRAQQQGAASLSDLLDVDRRLQDARDARLVAEADRSFAAIALIRALGGGVSSRAAPARTAASR